VQAQHFIAAAEQGHLRALEALLAQDVALHADGGGKGPALAGPVNGRERVARTLLAGMSALARRGVGLRVTEVNGQPGAMAFDAQDRLVGVMALELPRVRSRQSTPLPIPTSCGTSTGPATSAPCCARAADPATRAEPLVTAAMTASLVAAV
jgi:hypothetical protein